MVILLLIAFRIALEPIVEKYVNHVLANNESYTDGIDDVDIHLWRERTHRGTVIKKKDGDLGGRSSTSPRSISVD